MSAIEKLRRTLDSYTMYAVVLVGLAWLAFLAIILSALGVLSFSPIAMIASLVVLLLVSFATNWLLSRAYRLPFVRASPVITALILFFVMAVPVQTVDYVALSLAAIVAVSSKYVLTWRGAHIWNPAAFGAFVVVVCGIGFAAWWVATPWLLPFAAILGLIVLAKLRRFQFFAVFFVTAMALLLLRGVSFSDALQSWPIIFFGTIMLTEPATMPANRNLRLAYALVAGVLFGAAFDLGFITVSPLLALLLANVFGVVVSRRESTQAVLESRVRLTPSSWEYSFRPQNKLLPRQAGQYIECTLPGVAFDFRGNRRTFTIASSPGDEFVRVGVKFYNPGSNFKKSLANLQIGQPVLLSRPAGDFVLPAEASSKLLFLAGGIGITPFIAILRRLIAQNEQRDIVLLYFAADENEIAYQDVLEAANSHGVASHRMTGMQGLSEEMLRTYVPDLLQRISYISGPPSMVRACKALLRSRHVTGNRIKTDYFTGY